MAEAVAQPPVLCTWARLFRVLAGLCGSGLGREGAAADPVRGQGRSYN